MPEALPKPRSSLATHTGTTNNTLPPTTASPWTTARCHRLLRPLASKLQALKNIIQSNPSVTSANAARSRPKYHDPRDPDALFIEVAEKAGGSGGSRRPKPRRTYSSAGGGSRSNAPAPAPANDRSTANDHSYLAIWGSDGETPPPAPPARKPQRTAAPPDLNNPLTLLHGLKPTIHPSIFSLYLGIYTSLESVLLSTALPPPHPRVLPLRTLAARRIAHCILATSSEVDSDDIWYDAAADLGSSGEYLRDLVRWHAIELIRESTTDGLTQRADGGLGLAGILIGLCRTVGAEQEAQSLLQTLFDLHPVISSGNNPAVVAVKTFFEDTPEVLFRFLAKNFPAASANPSWLGSADIHTWLVRAGTDIDTVPGIDALMARALEATFGLWGEEHIAALATQRRDAARPSTRRPKSSAPPRPKITVMPYRIGMKAENIVLKITSSLIHLSLQTPSSKATTLLHNLVRGFLAQSTSIKSATEDVWGPRYPVAAKVAILLQGLGTDEDAAILDEVACCLKDVCGIGGREGMKSLAAFVAGCYEPSYGRLSRPDSVQVLASRLLNSTTKKAQGGVPPETPRPRVVVTFTPGPPRLGAEEEEREVRRWLLAQFALFVAVAYSLGERVRGDVGWVEWLGRFEARVVGLKMQTPGRVKVGAESEVEKVMMRKGRKGWRYEEGLDLWVAVGATPGRAKKVERRKEKLEEVVEEEEEEEEEGMDEIETDEDVETKETEEETDEEQEEDSNGSFLASVEIGLPTDNDWRKSYKVVSSPSSPISRPTTPTSRSARSSTESTTDSEDAEFYSNIRTTPPRTLRRSPRNTARIRRSLAVMLSSPIFTLSRTPAQTRSSALRKPFDFDAVGRSSPPSSPGWWDGEGGAGMSSPVVRRMGREVKEGGGSMCGFGGSSGIKRKRTLRELFDSSDDEDIPVRGGTDEMDTAPDIAADADSGEWESEEGAGNEDDADDLFTLAVNTALPSSSPPPPTPPPPPRRPKRTSLGALKASIDTTSRTPSREPTNSPEPMRSPVFTLENRHSRQESSECATPTRSPREPITLGRAIGSSSAESAIRVVVPAPTPMPQRRAMDDASQRKIEKEAKRRRGAKIAMRLAKMDEELGRDELGM